MGDEYHDAHPGSTLNNPPITGDSMSKKLNHLILAAAVGGLFAGASMSTIQAADADGKTVTEKTDTTGKHACKGLNACKGMGGGAAAEVGKNACKGQGACATVKHECKGHNDCKGQGGGDAAVKGKNDCKGKGGCKVG